MAQETQAHETQGGNHATHPQKPAHEIRRGAVKATIWEANGRKGPFFRIQLARLYKDGDDWKSSTSFTSQDIPKLSSVLVLAEDWIAANQKPATQ